MGTKAFERSYKRMLDVFDVLTIVVLAFEIVIITANVIMRYVFQNPLAWLDEFAGFGLIWLTFVTSLRLMEENLHLQVDVLTGRITLKWKLKVIHFFNYVLMACYFGVVVYYGFKLCHVLWFLSPTYTDSIEWIPQSAIYIIIPVASLCTLPILIKKMIGLRK